MHFAYKINLIFHPHSVEQCASLTASFCLKSLYSLAKDERIIFSSFALLPALTRSYSAT